MCDGRNMKKVLLVTTVSGFVPQFEMNNVCILQGMGFEVHYASNYNMPSYGTDNHRLDGTGIIRHQIDFVRSPFKRENLTVYRQLKDLMRDEKFELVHCHTPMGGVMARLAAHATGTRPVIYTAHGFHFFKGAPLKNWLFYYPVEKFLSRYTEQQICMNQEDYKRAQKKFHAKYVDYIPGLGIDLSNIIPVTEERRKRKRQGLGIADEKKVLLSVGELIKRKNHETVIKAIAGLRDDNIIYVICGHGELEGNLKRLAENLNVENQVFFLGYREDIYEIYSIADIFIFPSFQEGLPRALLEAMASGLPVICSGVRGSCDLMMDIPEKLNEKGLQICEGGIIVERADDTEKYEKAIQYMMTHTSVLETMGKYNLNRAKKFGIDKVGHIMKQIYERLLITS